MTDLKVISGGEAKEKETNIIKFSAIDKEFEFIFEAVVAFNGVIFHYSQSMPNTMPFGNERINVPLKETMVIVRKRVPWFLFFTKNFWKSYSKRKDEGLALCQKKFEDFKVQLVELRKEEQYYKNLVK